MSEFESADEDRPRRLRSKSECLYCSGVVQDASLQLLNEQDFLIDEGLSQAEQEQVEHKRSLLYSHINYEQYESHD